MENTDMQFIQNQIGYIFKNPDLLQQAFIRRSFSKENGGEDNEVLEFIGDKVLDVIVVKLLSKKYGFFLNECDDYDSNKEFNEFACELTEAELTKLKNKLVQKKTLANRIDFLTLSDYLIMGNSDIRNNVQKQDSAKEDLFEAILGAAAIDCNWNFDELQSIVEVMLDADILLNDDSETNYVNLFQEWFSKQYHCYPEYQYEHSSYYDEHSRWVSNNEIRSNPVRDPYITVIDAQKYSKTHFKCTIELFEKKFIGCGTSKIEARKDVCQLLYHYLEEKNLIFTIRDEISNPNKNEAIGQLETLARRDYFSIPVYDFKQTYDTNGNPVWHCTCYIADYETCFTARSSSKKGAKRNAAFKMLNFVLTN